MVVEVVARVLKYTSLFQPSEPSGGLRVCSYVVNTHLHNHYSHWNLLAAVVVGTRLFPKYTSPYNHQNPLYSGVVVAMVLKYTSLFQPSEPSDDRRVCSYYSKYTSPQSLQSLEPSGCCGCGY